MRRRAVVTGLGVIAPNGTGREAFWQSSLRGESWIRPLQRVESGTAFRPRVGEVLDFTATDHLPPRIVKQTDRSVHLAFACCRLAMEDSRLDLSREDPAGVGVLFSNLFGGMEFAEPELYVSTFEGPSRVSAYQAIAWFFAAAQGQWTITNELQGYAKTVAGDRAGGLQALGLAAAAVESEECRVVFAGGFEAPLAPFAYRCHESSGLLAGEPADPLWPYRPFDMARSGLVLGEGSGILLIEDRAHAEARRAPIYAELAGFASTFDAGPPSTRGREGEGLARCVDLALVDAGVAPDEVDYVSLEGLARETEDHAEAAALEQTFGEATRRIPVSAPKAMIGHTLAAAGAIDAIWTSLMIREQVVLPTVGLFRTDPECRLAFVQHRPRAARVRTAVCCCRGFGGLNAALVLRAPPGSFS